MANPNKINFGNVEASGNLGLAGSATFTFPGAAWTPIDASGAGLAFTIVAANCNYIRAGQLLIANFRLIYPVTADTAGAAIGGLPVASKAGTDGQGGFLSFNNASLDLYLSISAGNTTFIPFIQTGVQATNVQLSAKDLRGTLIYFLS